MPWPLATPAPKRPSTPPRKDRHERVTTREPSSAWSAALIGLTFATLWWAERRRPLRRRVEPRGRRAARNGVIAGLGGLTVSLLDVWHVLTHRVPLLWGVHRIHHADRDLDTTTAVRFHFGELALSVPWRAAQMVLLGVSPRALALWQSLLLASILFHHSNVRLPRRLERWLGWVVMTPRLHGIHHSIIEEERNSNWSSGLTVWDVLHGTLRRDVAQEALTIGVPELPRAEDVTLPRMLTLPFHHLEVPPGLAAHRTEGSTKGGAGQAGEAQKKHQDSRGDSDGQGHVERGGARRE